MVHLETGRNGALAMLHVEEEYNGEIGGASVHSMVDSIAVVTGLSQENVIHITAQVGKYKYKNRTRVIT